ncbi:hypothetical protein HDU97_000512 [Phlyctochytrium planicorne]|nr:hypothetical protein HDU97_000512 [Phlyctochytrium planicorne]
MADTHLSTEQESGGYDLGYYLDITQWSTNAKFSSGDSPVGPLGRFVKGIAEAVGIEQNAFATGGLTLGLLGALAAGARYFGSYFFEILKRNITVSAEYDSRDEAYLWMMNYLSDHSISKKARRFSVATTVFKSGQLVGEDTSNDSIALPPIYFLPSPGTHFFSFKNNILWLARERTKLAGGAESQNRLERITIYSFGRSRKILEDLAVEARRKFVEKDKARTIIYSGDQYGNWRRSRSRPIRPLSTIVLDRTTKTDVLSDIKEFLSSEMWYSERGIPYRRGYLFHGYPGTGKTSFVTALAGELKLNIYVISLANKGLTDETLTELMVDTPNRCILLLEDIDAAFVAREPISNAASNNIQSMAHAAAIATNVTFSGLLNAIDGVAAQEGRILIMTTNHMEKLDAALIRPGRIDVKVNFDRATKEQIRDLFIQFYPHDPSPSSHAATSDKLTQLAELFAERIPDRELSMAAVQGFLMKHKGHPERAVEQWRDLVEGKDR